MDYQNTNNMQMKGQGYQEDFNRFNQNEMDKKMNDYTFQQIETFLQTQVLNLN